MSRIVTAAFDDRDAAERAEAALRQLGARRIHRHVVPAATATGASAGAIGGEAGLPALLDALFLSHADFAAHREAMRRGGIVLSAQVEDRQAAEAVRLLDAAGARDLDAEAEAWRAQGWSPAAMAGAVTAQPGESPAMMPGTGGMDAEAMRMIAACSYAANTTGATPPATARGTGDPHPLLRRDPPVGRAQSHAIGAPLAEEPDPKRSGAH